ncbi:tripartite tricarboxylate transporter TctB family protein [Ammoniphilus sp. YIM 78166]|uniref:tripartite tricarboxylate transporter TctB family protein n=1 Tax=Ammoniphilus sp. YIM 78166 TaxID=1644106 RepID=UPI0010700A44|nr:tripartite tricarboxylate transporter TctB family protein [Ammoniphilus sp. YIM 78166]
MINRIHQDVVIGFIFILVSILLYMKTFDFMGEAAIYPRALIVFMIMFASLIIYSGLKKTKQLKEGHEVKYEGEEGPLTPSLLKSPFITLLIVGVYAGLLSVIGFFPATILFVIAFLWFMGVKKWKVYVLTSLGLNLFIYLLFVVQLNVHLPLGILFE